MGLGVLGRLGGGEGGAVVVFVAFHLVGKDALLDHESHV